MGEVLNYDRTTLPITSKLEGKFEDMEPSSVNIKKPSSEEKILTQHDVDKDLAEDDTDEAPAAVENLHQRVGSRVEEREAGGNRSLHE